MRVVSGAARGLCLETIVQDGIRPTTDRVKESIFNILQLEIHGRKFLDLFGGSGQMGIEAASRGCSEVFIVENDKNALSTIKRNVSKLKNRFNIRVVNSDAIEFLKKFEGKFDIAFLDPPYSSDLLNKVSCYIDLVMNKDGIVVVESSVDCDIKNDMGNFRKVKSYKYGKIIISVYKIENL